MGGDHDDGAVGVRGDVDGGRAERQPVEPARPAGADHTGGPTLYALDASTGRERWTYTPTSPGGQER
ncbi:hypothetical protein, partial [Actinomadura luteofluorescens]